MKSFKSLLLLLSAIFIGCDEDLPKNKFSMKIFTFKSLGQQNSKLPEDIITLSIPFKYNCSDIPQIFLQVDKEKKSPLLIRLGNNAQIDLSIELESMVTSSSLETLQDAVKNNLSKNYKINKEFAENFNLEKPSKQLIDSLISIKSKSDIYEILSDSTFIYNGINSFNNVDSLKKNIGNLLCSNDRIKNIIIIYGVHSQELLNSSKAEVMPVSNIAYFHNENEVATGYICENYIKYKKLHDGKGGFKKGNLIMRNSPECGYRESASTWVTIQRNKCENYILYDLQKNSTTGEIRKIRIGSCDGSSPPPPPISNSSQKKDKVVPDEIKGPLKVIVTPQDKPVKN